MQGRRNNVLLSQLQTMEYGDGHSVVLCTMDSLAYAYSKYGSHDNALEVSKSDYLHKTTGNFCTYSPNHLTNRSRHSCFLSVFFFLQQLYKQMFQVQKDKVKAESSSTNNTSALSLECARTLHKMSIVYEKQGNLSAALECTSQILSIQRKVLDHNHPDVAATKKSLSRLVSKARAAGHPGDYNR